MARAWAGQGRLSFMIGGRAADDRLMRAARAHREREEQARAARPEPERETIVLVACSKKKAAVEAPAEELYTSPLFRKARRYAELHGDRWFIISALHGLTEPQKVIKPYNVTLKSFRKCEREQWAHCHVLSRLPKRAAAGSRIIILAGRAYYEQLEGELQRRGYQVEIPMRGLDIYAMLQFLNKELGGVGQQ